MILIALLLVGLASCASPPAVKHDVNQIPIASRVYPVELQAIRTSVIARFGPSSTLPPPFGSMQAIELKPPNYGGDWAGTWIDPGGFLDAYKRIPADLRLNDLLIEEPTGDLYWPSEYTTSAGPVKFRCGFILHFTAQGSSSTEVQVYEKVPTIWVGEHWAFARHGIGFGKVHDIRPVEPTVKDRVDMLDLIGKLY